MVRCLAAQLPRGKLLSEIGSSLVVGRLQSSAFVTRHMRLNSQTNDQTNKGPAQVVLNDLARVLLGVRRTDHYKVADLVDKSGLPTVNAKVQYRLGKPQMVVHSKRSWSHMMTAPEAQLAT